MTLPAALANVAPPPEPASPPLPVKSVAPAPSQPPPVPSATVPPAREKSVASAPDASPPVKPAAPAKPVVPAAPPVVEENGFEIVDAPPAVAAKPMAASVAASSPLDAPGLGQFVKQYQPRRWWIGLIVFTLLFLGNVPCTIAVFWIADRSKPWIAAAMIPNAAWLIGIIICGGFFLLGVNQRIRLHERGLQMSTLFRKAEVRWTEVTGIYLAKSGMFQPLVILLDRGDQPQLDLPAAIKGSKELADRIIAATTALLLPKINQALDRGEIVAFGPLLSVGPSGLIFRPQGAKGKTFKMRWDEIKTFTVGLYQTNLGAGGLAAAASVQAQLRIVSTDQAPWVCATGNIANFGLLVEVVKERFGVKIS
jgi:hypothetical protein